MAGLLFLIGLPACGKSTLGHAVKETEQVTFIDLDNTIEEHERLTIPQIFDTLGEEYFRRCETVILSELCATYSSHDNCNPVIIACGGGTPCNPGAMDLMLASGHVIWLQASRERLLKRLYSEQLKRPRTAGLSPREIEEYLDATAEIRLDAYKRASSTFDSTFLDTSDEVKSTVSQFITKYLH
ncbi:MAG: shikimate kinase [Odoribacter sp.]|nr:shikimate kinase [Odoribacter sp.]